MSETQNHEKAVESPKGTLARWRKAANERAARRELMRLLPEIGPGLVAGLVAGMLLTVVFSTLFMLATGLLVGSIPAAVRDGLDSAAGGHLVRALVIVAGLFVVEQFIWPFTNLFAGSLGRRVDTVLQRRVMTATLRPVGISHLEDPATLDLIRDAKGVGTGQWTPGGAVEGLRQNFQSRLNTFAAAGLVASYRWWLAVLLLVFGAVMRFRILDDALRGASWSREQTPRLRRSDYLRDVALTPQAAKETRIFGLGSWLLERFSHHWMTAMREIWRHRKATTTASWAWTFPWGGLVLVSLYLVGNSAASGEIGVGRLAVLAQAVLGAGSIWLSNADVSVAYGALSVPVVQKLERSAAELAAQMDVGTDDPAGRPTSEIRFDGVSFAYPGRETNVFTDLDLAIPAGRSLAIVGRNGAGKTTLVKLLARLHEPTGGQLTVDGIDARTFDAQKWQRCIAAIFQDYVKYELGARENIVYGAVEHRDDEERLASVASQAGALAIVERLGKGWETVLSREYTDGAELSGGEWQRIALARAIFAVRSGARVLVLDEPTANLDVRAEAEVFDRFLELTRGLTTILISHRFSTVRHADEICVLEEGRIIERGSHADLLAADGRYAHMFRLQAARFQEDVVSEDGPGDADA